MLPGGMLKTSIVSIYTWGFNSFGEAFFIMNVFHALQYFGIVWASERGNLTCLIGGSDGRAGRLRTLGVFLGATFAYGFLAEAVGPDSEWFLALTLVVSIMHFWYDGFIWSVRRHQV
jgi:hypothetical protein